MPYSQRTAGQGAGCAVSELYPEIEPYAHGMLDVGDGNKVYWEVCGNPNGKPVVGLHGGPGAGWNKGIRRFFDPQAYRIILFDQRNCGRSTPNASEPHINLAHNSTEHLLRDMEQLREQLGVNQWVVFGGSWGCTLGLAYAERHPDRVLGAVFVAVTSTRKSEIDWLYYGAARFYPEAWERFRAGVAPEHREGDLIAAYHRLLIHPDPAIHLKAARDWHEWEDSLISVDPERKPNQDRLDPVFQLTFARLVTHYFGNLAWLEDGQLLRDAGRLAGIPGILIHGRFDMGGPPTTAWELTRAWPGSELIMVGGAGHSTKDPGMTEAVLDALNRMR